MALFLLERLLAFDPKCRLTAAEALADPYFNGMAKQELEPSIQPISKLEFEFERRKLSKDDVRELIYAEILEYHPQMRQGCLRGGDHPTTFMYPSGVNRFKLQFAHLEEHHGKGERRSPLQRQNISLPRTFGTKRFSRLDSEIKAAVETNEELQELLFNISVAVQYLGYIYSLVHFWITGTLFIVGGCACAS